MSEKNKVDAYLNTVSQLEPDISPVDRDAALTSIAISLKRIADTFSEILAAAKADINGK